MNNTQKNDASKHFNKLLLQMDIDPSPTSMVQNEKLKTCKLIQHNSNSFYKIEENNREIKRLYLNYKESKDHMIDNCAKNQVHCNAQRGYFLKAKQKPKLPSHIKIVGLGNDFSLVKGPILYFQPFQCFTILLTIYIYIQVLYICTC